jgi:hypothetical protein
MSQSIKNILQSDKKPKEKVSIITKKILGGEIPIGQLFELFVFGTDVEKGTCAEIMKLVSKEHPQMMEPYINTLLEYITYKAPRVKWGVPETLGNLASVYPEKVEKAIPYLKQNLDDRSTVIRWCASYALTEIAKYNRKKQKALIEYFTSVIKTEQNNGVKNLYLNAIAFIEKK